jgi:hypothetical protein
MERLERTLRSPHVQFIDDNPYREDALEATFREARLGKRAISFVDMLLRVMIQDTNVRIDALLTFNIKDFFDVCASRRVRML